PAAVCPPLWPDRSHRGDGRQSSIETPDTHVAANSSRNDLQTVLPDGVYAAARFPPARIPLQRLAGASRLCAPLSLSISFHSGVKPASTQARLRATAPLRQLIMPEARRGKR